jgi:hypothetical protein
MPILIVVIMTSMDGHVTRDYCRNGYIVLYTYAFIAINVPALSDCHFIPLSEETFGHDVALFPRNLNSVIMIPLGVYN